jgi:hypothetical protein
MVFCHCMDLDIPQPMESWSIDAPSEILFDLQTRLKEKNMPIERGEECNSCFIC